MLFACITMQACHPLSFKTSVKLSNPMRMFTKHTTPHLSLPRLMGGCLTVILLSNSILLKPRSFWLKSYFQSEGSGGEKVLPEIDSFFHWLLKQNTTEKKFYSFFFFGLLKPKYLTTRIHIFPRTLIQLFIIQSNQCACLTANTYLPINLISLYSLWEQTRVPRGKSHTENMLNKQKGLSTV